MPAAAEDEPRLEITSGTDITAHSSFGYAGAVWALGQNLYAPGWRFKALGGYGSYDYDGSLSSAGGSVPTRFEGDVVLGELMAGRLWRYGEWTVKAYAGVQYEDHGLTPDDPSNAVQGTEWGGIAQVELWRNLGPRNWFSANGSYGTAFGDFWAQARLGHRLTDRISLGLEGGGLGNKGYDAGRGGAFLRLHLGVAELTLSGGVTGDYYGEDTSGYVALGFYRRR